MSRYAHRLSATSSQASRYAQPQRYYDDYPQEDGLDEDDETAVGTDLSNLQQQQPRRGVSFGPNEVEEFNGSEAPDAVLPAPSLSRLRTATPVGGAAPSRQQHYAGVSSLAPPPGIGRPRSTSIDGRRSAQPILAPAQPKRVVIDNARYASSHEMPPPPVPVSSVRKYGSARPTSFARGEAYPSSSEEDEATTPRGFGPAGVGGGGTDDDDDDAFTAVGTGVATDLDLDPSAGGNAGQTQDPLRRIAAAQGRYSAGQYAGGRGSGGAADSSYLAVQRPPSRGVQVRRPSPALPQNVPRYSASGYEASDFDYPDGEERDDAFSRRRSMLPPPPAPPVQRSFVSSPYGGGAGGGGIARPVSNASSRMQVDEYDDAPSSSGGAPQAPPVAYQRRPEPGRRGVVQQDLPEDSPIEKELINLLKDLRFSVALKDFHDTMRIGVQKTLVAEDGMGHAYCKVHCKRLPKHEDIEREDHLKQHWIPIAGSRWEFRTASHRVTVVFKTAALAAYEAQFLTSPRR